MNQKTMLMLGLGTLVLGMLLMPFGDSPVGAGISYGVAGLTLTLLGLVLKSIAGKTPEFEKALSLASLAFLGLQFIVYAGAMLRVLASAPSAAPNVHFMFALGAVFGLVGALFLLLFGLSGVVSPAHAQKEPRRPSGGGQPPQAQVPHQAAMPQTPFQGQPSFQGQPFPGGGQGGFVPPPPYNPNDPNQR
jgi:Ca2+/Na+ antiporter